AFAWTTPADRDVPRGGIPYDHGVRGTGPALTLVRAQAPVTRRSLQSQTDTAPGDNAATVTIKVTGTNKANFAAVGATLHGKAGALVHARIGARNEGPATVDQHRFGKPVQTVEFAVPPGTTVASAPKACMPEAHGVPDSGHPGRPGASRYQCRSATIFPAGQSVTWDFGVRITTPASKPGTVGINYEPSAPGQRQVDLKPHGRLGPGTRQPGRGRAGTARHRPADRDDRRRRRHRPRARPGRLHLGPQAPPSLTRFRRSVCRWAGQGRSRGTRFGEGLRGGGGRSGRRCGRRGVSSLGGSGWGPGA
ncbi:MAG: hypothetical protein QOD41_3432, partial [Cryptosporangiaceae bacterium]|nr:hypothetical protein [Cryptosporangiaceae bacterium]